MEIEVVCSLKFNLYHYDPLGLVGAMSGLFPEEPWAMIGKRATANLIDLLYGECVRTGVFYHLVCANPSCSP